MEAKNGWNSIRARNWQRKQKDASEPGTFNVVWREEFDLFQWQKYVHVVKRVSDEDCMKFTILKTAAQLKLPYAFFFSYHFYSLLTKEKTRTNVKLTSDQLIIDRDGETEMFTLETVFSRRELLLPLYQVLFLCCSCTFQCILRRSRIVELDCSKRLLPTMASATWRGWHRQETRTVRNSPGCQYLEPRKLELTLTLFFCDWINGEQKIVFDQTHFPEKKKYIFYSFGRFIHFGQSFLSMQANP